MKVNSKHCWGDICSLLEFETIYIRNARALRNIFNSTKERCTCLCWVSSVFEGSHFHARWSTDRNRQTFTKFFCYWSYLIICFLLLNYQEANKRNNNWLPPPWAIVALVVLGFNEFMTLLRYFTSAILLRCPMLLLLDMCLFFGGRNPFYLGVIFVGFLLVKALWVQLDVSGEFRHGAVSVNSLVWLFFCHLILDYRELSANIDDNFSSRERLSYTYIRSPIFYEVGRASSFLISDLNDEAGQLRKLRCSWDCNQWVVGL